MTTFLTIYLLIGAAWGTYDNILVYQYAHQNKKKVLKLFLPAWFFVTAALWPLSIILRFFVLGEKMSVTNNAMKISYGVASGYSGYSGSSGGKNSGYSGRSGFSGSSGYSGSGYSGKPSSGYSGRPKSGFSGSSGYSGQ